MRENKYSNNYDNFFDQSNNEVNYFDLEEKPVDKFSVGFDSQRRLNDYDFNILKEEAYKDVSNELLKLEYKISNIEKELNLVDAKIQSSRDIGDYNSVEYFINRKTFLQEDLNYFMSIYNNKGVSAKISGGILAVVSPMFKKIVYLAHKFTDDLWESIISCLPSKFSNVLEMKNSLNKLENINKSVNELMSMQIPYGESEQKYDQLSRYIIRANSIQSKISRSLK